MRELNASKVPDSFENKNPATSSRFLIIPLLLLALSCQKSSDPAPQDLRGTQKLDSTRAKLCPPAQDGKHLDSKSGVAAENAIGTPQFSEIRNAVNTSCQECHMAPAAKGGFTYIDSLLSQELSIGGVKAIYPGLKEAAPRILAALGETDLKKRMPPEPIRNGNPEAFIKLQEKIQAWMNAGFPDLQPTANSGGTQENSTGVDLDCTPTQELVGSDFATDRKFASLDRLPKNLSETDLFSLDAFELAKKGTVAYAVEYPLWADNAEKGRFIHVPMKIENKTLLKQAIKLNPRTKAFEIPENTRFYKSFYRQIKTKEGATRFKRIETRLILVRYPSEEKTLFGTYRWDDEEKSATLVEEPYRNGQPFKDTIFDIVIDEATGQTRKYATPGRHRCLECHQGSESRSLILGFSPLQIHRRLEGEGGSLSHPTSADLTQVKRLTDYGVISGVRDENALPFMEDLGEVPYRNRHELRAQGYLFANCAHCHNPNGFAKANDIGLQFTAGSVFGFNPRTPSQQEANMRIIDGRGDPDRSYLYHKLKDPPEKQNMRSQMPMHTPGLPNCQSLRLIGKWIRSFESESAADLWEPNCPSTETFQWTDQDFTEAHSDTYVPRRDDWDSLLSGMPSIYRDLRFSPELKAAVQRRYPTGYWFPKPECRFPNTTLPPEERRPWMTDSDGQPNQPYGEIYYTTPGSWYFQTTCAKCHGPRADGKSALATGISNWSGGKVRVANLIDGMFGKSGENLKVFDKGSDNLAGNYLIWMAMEGTRVKFPDQLSDIIGSHGGKMLTLVRDRCIRQISSEKRSTPLYEDHEIFREVCFIGNRKPDDPELQYNPDTGLPLNQKAVDEWADRAAFNAGWAIFDYLQQLSAGTAPARGDECEKAFPRRK